MAKGIAPGPEFIELLNQFGPGAVGNPIVLLQDLFQPSGEGIHTVGQ